jgi:molybdopterin synthase catalytic subunit
MSILSPQPAAAELKFITDRPIDIDKLLHEAHRPEAGGIVLFCGEVRDNNASRPVKHLVYESYVSMAEKVIREIVETAIKKWNLQYAYSLHRIGRLNISACAVAVVTAHAHRKEAYEANQYIIDRIKHEAPIWKCEYYQDGTHEWGRSC